MNPNELYIEMTKRLELAQNRAAITICLLVVIDSATSWSRLLLSLTINMVMHISNLIATRYAIPRYGAKGDLARTIANAVLAFCLYGLIDWPIAVWLWLPYVALAFDQFGGRYSMHSVTAMCVLMGLGGIRDGVSPLVPLTFTVLAVIAWCLANGRMAIIRSMFATSENHRRALAAEMAARRAAESELLEASRRAGMAEVATGVLHNVGNVLNSVNVSISLAVERVRESRVLTLTKLVDLYERHPGGLPGLLASPKGPSVVPVLSGAARDLSGERKELEIELAEVMQHVEHIKGIVSAQQQLARVSAVHETVDVEETVDSALLIGTATISPNVEIVRDYRDAPAILTDRHKLLQILVNLISNAGQAVDASGRIIVRLRKAAERVVVDVEDNGAGIASDHLDRIFQHGFTTKPNGHGFGLHTSANSARELGGSLAVASAGVGLGARFTLELPEAS